MVLSLFLKEFKNIIRLLYKITQVLKDNYVNYIHLEHLSTAKNILTLRTDNYFSIPVP